MKLAAWWCWLALIVVNTLATGQLAAQDQDKDKPGEDAVKVEAPKVTLLEPGAEPRKPLRFAINKDEASTITMIMRMNMTQSMGDMKMPPTKLPGMKMVMNTQVVGVDASGDFEHEFTFTEATTIDEAGVMPQIAEMMKNSLKSIVGLKGRATVSSRGFVKKAEMDIPPNADAMTKQQLESMRHSLTQFCAPLPDEPVGVGGKWKVEADLSAGGLDMKQDSVMTLEKIEGEQLQIKVELTQSAPPQPIDTQGGPKLNLVSMNGKGDGMMTLLLSSPFPTRANVTSKNDQEMTINMNGNNQPFKQTIEMQMELERSAAAKEEKPTTPP